MDRFKLTRVSEQENSLIEQLRSFGVSIEDLEALTGEEHTPVEHVVESEPPAEVAVETPAAPSAQTGPPVAFQPLGSETTATVREDTSLKEDTAGLRHQAALFDANQTRDRILAEAKDAAAEIRANAVRLVSVKLQAAEDEIMTMRAKATEEVAQLRKETSKALAARLQEAGSEALALREAARQETQVFWESASREFSDALGAHQPDARPHGAAARERERRGGVGGGGGEFYRRTVREPPRSSFPPRGTRVAHSPRPWASRGVGRAPGRRAGWACRVGVTPPWDSIMERGR